MTAEMEEGKWSDNKKEMRSYPKKLSLKEAGKIESNTVPGPRSSVQ